MTNEDLDRFVEIMMGLAENYPGARLTGAGLDMRFEAMKEYTIDQVSKSATKLIRTHRFNTMPTTADIINAMDGVASRITMEDRAEIEAGKVLDHLHRFGILVIPYFDDPITRNLMEGQWRYHSWASRVHVADLKWWRRDFVRAYKAQAAGINAGVCLPLVDLVQSITRGLAIDLAQQPG
ncbi:hypothetical protein [Desulfocicer niacini]